MKKIFTHTGEFVKVSELMDASESMTPIQKFRMIFMYSQFKEEIEWRERWRDIL